MQGDIFLCMEEDVYLSVDDVIDEFELRKGKRETRAGINLLLVARINLSIRPTNQYQQYI